MILSSWILCIAILIASTSAYDCVNGSKLLGRCFCHPGFTDDKCDRQIPSRDCSVSSDACFVTPMGVCIISQARWKRALAAEANVWSGSGGNTDRGPDHLGGFFDYSSLPVQLGRFLEVGCGPWTQSRHMFQTRPELVATDVTLWEPNLFFYMTHTPMFI